METRYSHPEIRDHRSPHQTVYRYHRILTELADAQRAAGLFERDVAAALRATPLVSPNVWERFEMVTRHSTAAYIDALRSSLSLEDARLVYLGLTSSDLQDTADAMQYRDCLAVILDLQQELDAALVHTAPTIELRMGRTHGRVAVPVESGKLYRRAALDLRICKDRLIYSTLPGTLSGPVGEYGTGLSREIEKKALAKLGLAPEPIPTQTVNRSKWARAAFEVYQLIAVCDQLATNHRLLATLDIFTEDFAYGKQKGSSVMPHKRNPIRSERVNGLARVARGYLSAILETASTQWLERDLTNSSVERVAFWDLVDLAAFLLSETAEIVQYGQHFYDPACMYYENDPDELAKRCLAGENPDEVYREIQKRAMENG